MQTTFIVKNLTETARKGGVNLMSTVQIFRRNGFVVEWEKPALTLQGTYWLTGEVSGHTYRKAYYGGEDAKRRAIAACKRKGGNLVRLAQSAR